MILLKHNVWQACYCPLCVYDIHTSDAAIWKIYEKFVLSYNKQYENRLRLNICKELLHNHCLLESRDCMSDIIVFITGWIILSSIISPFLGKLLASNREKYEYSQFVLQQEVIRRAPRNRLSS